MPSQPISLTFQQAAREQLQQPNPRLGRVYLAAARLQASNLIQGSALSTLLGFGHARHPRHALACPEAPDGLQLAPDERTRPNLPQISWWGSRACPRPRPRPRPRENGILPLFRMFLGKFIFLPESFADTTISKGSDSGSSLHPLASTIGRKMHFQGLESCLEDRFRSWALLFSSPCT